MSTLRAIAFDCIEKHCPEMQSCAEAYHHFSVCGEAKRDADGDGIPCENVCGKTLKEFRHRLGEVAPATAPLRQAPRSVADPQAVAPDEPTAFTCAGKRTCGQMTSCAEARFYLSNCGVGTLDRDRDGVPCESLCGGR